MADPEVRVRSWVRGSPAEARDGLIGYLSVFYGALVVNGITVRRTAAGKLALSFPEHRDGKGRRHSVVRPVDDNARAAIEAAVFGQATMQSEVRP